MVMSNFHIGQKVVYIGENIHPDFIEPQKHEIITISSFCDIYKGSVRVYEYPFSKKGELQSFDPTTIRHLDTKFAEELINYISNSKNEKIQ